VLRGGGTITDLGCYGANLITWIMEGKKPISVTVITTQQQAENNPKVNDEALIILTYENAVALLISLLELANWKVRIWKSMNYSEQFTQIIVMI